MQAELQKTSVKPAKRPMFHTKVLPPTRVSSSCISEQRQRARFPPDTQPLLILFSPASHCCLGGFNTWLKLTYRFKDQRTLTDFFHHLNFFQTRKKIYPSKKYFLPGEFLQPCEYQRETALLNSEDNCPLCISDWTKTVLQGTINLQNQFFVRRLNFNCLRNGGAGLVITV